MAHRLLGTSPSDPFRVPGYRQDYKLRPITHRVNEVLYNLSNDVVSLTIHGWVPSTLFSSIEPAIKIHCLIPPVL